MPNSCENIPMYTDGPKRAVLPRKEYRAQATSINVFLVLPHCSGSFGSSAGTGNSAWPYPVSSPSAARRLTVPGMSSSRAWLGSV